CSHVATVEVASNTSAPPSGGRFSSTPVRCAYCARRMLARLGAQSAVDTCPLVNVTPWFASSLVKNGMTGPAQPGDWCVPSTVSQRWSSDRMMTKLGAPAMLGERDGGDGAPGVVQIDVAGSMSVEIASAASPMQSAASSGVVLPRQLPPRGGATGVVQ